MRSVDAADVIREVLHESASAARSPRGGSGEVLSSERVLARAITRIAQLRTRGVEVRGCSAPALIRALDACREWRI